MSAQGVLVSQADPQNERGIKSRDYKFRRGTTAWTKENVRSLIVSDDVKVTAGAGKEQPIAEASTQPPTAPVGEGMDVDL
jgi:20S proteasome subunit beta 2